MKIDLYRQPSTLTCTPGDLYVDGIWNCYTLEDVVRDEKIPGETAIPAGEYKVIVTYSNRFKCDLPLLVDVPGFTGVRIHPGNTDADTHGCVLVGQTKGVESVGNSRAAFKVLFDKIKANADDCTIAIHAA